MSWKLQNGILVPEAPPKMQESLHHLPCTLCGRSVEGEPLFNCNFPWPTCGHGRFPQHVECQRALDHAFPMDDMPARLAAYSVAGCPTCGCNEFYT